jgi:hypothetical protein
MSSERVPTARKKAAARLRMALGLFETGVEMMRQKIRRDHPALGDHEVEARLGSWLRERPGAEFGDAVGRPAVWPRRSGRDAPGEPPRGGAPRPLVEPGRSS